MGVRRLLLLILIGIVVAVVVRIQSGPMQVNDQISVQRS